MPGRASVYTHSIEGECRPKPTGIRSRGLPWKEIADMGQNREAVETDETSGGDSKDQRGFPAPSEATRRQGEGS